MGTITPGQNRSGSNGKEGILYTPQGHRSGTSSSEVAEYHIQDTTFEDGYSLYSVFKVTLNKVCGMILVRDSSLSLSLSLSLSTPTLSASTC